MSELWIDHVSFSQLTSAEECPYGYYLQRIEGVEQVSNAFAEAGTLAHELLAAWAKGEIELRELPMLWIKRFPLVVTSPLPYYLETKGYRAKLFDSILTYFETFDGFPGFEVVGAEKQFSSSLAGVPFVGVIDLVLRSKETGKLMLMDHKSCSLARFKKSKELLYRQLLLYAKFCADEYGSFPHLLRFNLFKERKIDERPFDPEDFRAAKMWAEQLITEMKEKDIVGWFETRPELFRCTNLCGCRNLCCFGQAENHKRKEEKNDKTRLAVTAG